MGLLELFIASTIPVIKVLLVTALGSYLALDRINLLGEDARKHLNNVSLCFFHYVNALFSFCLVKKHFRLQSLHLVILQVDIRFAFVFTLWIRPLFTKTIHFHRSFFHVKKEMKDLCWLLFLFNRLYFLFSTLHWFRATWRRQ